MWKVFGFPSTNTETTYCVWSFSPSAQWQLGRPQARLRSTKGAWQHLTQRAKATDERAGLEIRVTRHFVIRSQLILILGSEQGQVKTHLRNGKNDPNRCALGKSLSANDFSLLPFTGLRNRCAGECGSLLRLPDGRSDVSVPSTRLR